MTEPFTAVMRPVYHVQLNGKRRGYLTKRGAWCAYVWSRIRLKKECACEPAEHDEFGNLVAGFEACELHDGSLRKLHQRAVSLFCRWSKSGAK